ncbi:lipid-A-disaccharide synthase [Hyphomicrobium sp.]|uniref:lipid-A-disaccharide synthase n=1 Tax=Hyphomicrobium sp. TaxID=82 RepID=UPI002D7907C0|nr:lipid-A-disaccharide synthase [Hyphomicrobium sp.]HET6389470.1 lipid-A-disaccharide synthase [Hyphomicrobium sp.]
MKRIGIIAGSGSLPLEVAESVTRRGGEVHVVMVEGAANPALAAYPHTIVNWAQPGRAAAAIRRAGISDALLLGGYGRPALATARPDLTFVRLVPTVAKLLKAGGDDAVLRGLLALFESLGLNVVGVEQVAPELLISDGSLTNAVPSPSSTADIALGFDLVAALGPYDIGQAAVVSRGRIEAIEGAEGTDRMLKRVAEARRARGDSERYGVLVKRPKPGQDLRVDLPAIGPNTVEGASAAGLSGIAVMAGHVLTADRSQMIARADEHALFITGVKAGQGTSDKATIPDIRTGALGDLRADAAAEKDIARAAGVLSALTPFGGGSAVVIDRGRILAVGTSEDPASVADRVRLLRGKNTRRRGVLVLGETYALDEALMTAVQSAHLTGIAITGTSETSPSFIQLANKSTTFLASANSGSGPKPLKIFLVAGEHSGDALGAKLIGALKKQYPGQIEFSGVGGEEMAEQGFRSLFPIEDVAVMGPMSILPKLPRILRRVYQTVDEAVAFAPDAVVIIDSPEFTHPIAKRIRKRAPHIPIVDYVSPSVWAWRPGRAKRMRPYVDHILALLPFEPAAHERLGGPACTYVGHPLIEKLDEIQNADAKGLASRLNLAPERPVLLVLPGSRTSEVDRLIDVFGEAVTRLANMGPFEVVIPAVRHLRQRIEEKTANWTVKPHILDASADDKYAAMRLARAALAASGTVTLELALAGTPSVVAYKVDKLIANLRFLLKVSSVVLANLVIGRNVYPEYLQEACTAENLANALEPLLGDTEARKAQVEGLRLAPEKLRLAASSPSEAAANVVLSVVTGQAAGKSRRGGPT